MERKNKENFEEQIKRILLGFFILMFVFTVLSRSVDSMAVPLVTAAGPFKGTISYESYGEGVVKENGEKYTRFITGYQIASVDKMQGDKVARGDVLFSYELKEIKDSYNTIYNELKKLRIEYEKLSLDDGTKESRTEEETARLNLDYAREDLQAARKSREEKIEKRIEEEKKSLEKATEEFNLILEERKIEEKAAQRAAEDAQAALDKLNKVKAELSDAMEHYRSGILGGDKNAIAVLREVLFDFYYNGKYKEHKEEVNSAEKAVKRAAEDNDGETAGLRNLEDAKEALERLTKEDKKLKEAMNNYESALLSDNEAYVSNCYSVLFSLLYKKREPDPAQINDGETALVRARADAGEVSEKWDEKEFEKEEEISELSDKIDRMEEGIYDFTDDLMEEERAVEAAERAMELAKLTLKSIQEGKSIDSRNAFTALENKALSLQSAWLDIQAKEEELKEINNLLENKGRVYAQADGVIHEIDIKSGQFITGQEKLTIAVEGCFFEGKAYKDEMEHFVQGDEILLWLEENKSEPFTIESIAAPDEEGMVIFTALLPVEEVTVGQSLSYKIAKTSKAYDMVLPLGAIRQSNSGTYVLVITEKQGILGTEKFAFALQVNVLEQDYKNAAVEGGITDKDLVITGSSKNIEEGNRVRMDEAE